MSHSRAVPALCRGCSERRLLAQLTLRLCSGGGEAPRGLLQCRVLCPLPKAMSSSGRPHVPSHAGVGPPLVPRSGGRQCQAVCARRVGSTGQTAPLCPVPSPALSSQLEATLDLAERRRIRSAIRELQRQELERDEEALASKRFRTERGSHRQDNKENWLR